MRQKEFFRNSLDGLNLFFQSWLPENDPKAIIYLIHGLGEHSGRYQHLSGILTENQFAVYSMDNRGHGKSSGVRGHVDHFEDFLNDIGTLIQSARQDFPNKPAFLYGHSLGGILVLSHALNRKPDIHGVIATSPGLRTALEKQKVKIMMSKLMASIYPKMSIPTGLNPNHISHDPKVVEKYKNDPLVHDRGTPGLAVNLLNAIRLAYQDANNFPVPLLIMHGTEDKIAYASGSQEFASKVEGDCTLRLWEGMAHEIHNEPDKDKVFEYLLNWLENKI